MAEIASDGDGSGARLRCGSGADNGDKRQAVVLRVGGCVVCPKAIKGRRRAVQMTEIELYR